MSFPASRVCMRSSIEGTRQEPVIVYRVVGDEVVFLCLFHQMQLYDRLIDMSQEGGLD